MWFRKPKAEETLKPGICECGHNRSVHIDGRGHCMVDLTAEVAKELRDSRPTATWTCACQVFILDEDGDDDSPEAPIDPEVAELKKIAGID